LRTRDDPDVSARAGDNPASWGLLSLAEIQLGRPSSCNGHGEATMMISEVLDADRWRARL
jgi:hypothetical protein